MVRLATANVHGAATPPLSRLLVTGKPDVIVLTEAHNAIRHCKRWGRSHGYTPWGGLTDCVVLVRAGSLRERALIQMTKVWWWGKNRWNLRRREPRTYIVVAVVPYGWKRLLWVLAVHLPPGGPDGAVHRTGGKNKPAWHESARYGVQFLKKRVGKPRAMFGDINAEEEEIDEFIATPADALVVMGSKVDGGVYAGMRHETTRRLKGDDLLGHGWSIMKFSIKG